MKLSSKNMNKNLKKLIPSAGIETSKSKKKNPHGKTSQFSFLIPHAKIEAAISKYSFIRIGEILKNAFTRWSVFGFQFLARGTNIAIWLVYRWIQNF